MRIFFITPVNQVLSLVPVMRVTLVTVFHALMSMSVPPLHVTKMHHALTLPAATFAPATPVTPVTAPAAKTLTSVSQTHAQQMAAVTIPQAHGGIIYLLFIISLFILI